MFAQYYSTLLLALGGLDFVPFGSSTPAVANPPDQVGSTSPSSSAGQSEYGPEPQYEPHRPRADNGGNSGFSVVTRCTVPGTAALTFDDGPYIYTNDIVGMLRDANATATFFYNGKNYGCIYDPDSVGRVQLAYSSGHQIASHTWSHADLSLLSWDQINDEMWKIDNALNKIIGVSPAFMRPPYGSYNDLVLRAASYRRQTVVTWDFDSQDTGGVSVDTSKNLYAQVVDKHPDTILTLNHETSDSAVHQVIPFAIQKLQSAGYRLVSVAECLGMPAYLNTGPPMERDASWGC